MLVGSLRVFKCQFALTLKKFGEEKTYDLSVLRDVVRVKSAKGFVTCRLPGRTISAIIGNEEGVFVFNRYGELRVRLLHFI